MKRKYILRALVAVLCFFNITTVFADIPYRSYNYNYWKQAVPAPAPYEPTLSLSGNDLGIGSFSNPKDLHITANGDIYILDSGNNRIVVVDQNYTLIREITGFINQGKEDTFSDANGLNVGRDGSIHIADTGNKRVVSLDSEGNLIRTITMEENPLTGEVFNFLPTRVVVDAVNRYYVIARNVFEGMMCFDEDGSFFGYFGSIQVQSSVIDRFWKQLATEAQRKKIQLFIPTEFTSLDIDEEGFVYATNVDYQSSQNIRRINPSGKDVLVNYTSKNIIGDLNAKPSNQENGGKTRFVDIEVRDKGIYSALDLTRGRIYTYDSEGNLLYIFGGIGNQLGMFKLPVALESYNESLYVLDQGRGELVCFDATRYGHLIDTAVGLRYDGQETEAVKYWEEVLKLDSNYELAYTGIGKSLLAANENKEAMEYLQKGYDKKYYSVAYKRYRTEVLKENLPMVFMIGSILVVLYIVWRVYKKVKERRGA